ncbi:hypothetical protein GOP47_0019953 [Adiantum capillus-veneris]|uniref:Uncharacterized protein n=1 Tax=Adiantum capillus-veneris TaxID=13818 RepID=A0A9D4Z7J0_ADICA|nr:hypothetical protein GOP47_0019953 [Adiantum capillus-veneris]
MVPAKEDEADVDEGRGSHSYSEAAFRVTIARLLWIYSLTAALVFEFIFECKLQRSRAVVENGKKLAREISIITIGNALKGTSVFLW